ncbi:tetratricopeptide repeat protein [Tellurirhabdus bombi]|uniref:tetratricopeptide repeat protein n=1 Tax=Tellurirhabdus bombi TaxID=2907205 RepID=UPI001F3ECF02|nr:hypothetical protein [Tellurirhabdus bombi]
MSSIFFWQKWSTAHRVSLWTGIVILLAALACLIAAWVLGLQNVVRWDVLSELLDIPTTISSFTDGLFDYPINGKAYIVAEQFVASAMQTNILAARLMALGICFGLAFIYAAITRLNRWPYLVAMALLIVLLATFRLETLQLSGFLGTVFSGRLSFLLLVLLLSGVSYYFHAFQTEASLATRLLAFLTVIILSWLLLQGLADQRQPAMAFVSYAMPGFLLITIGFIFLTSTEIIAGLVYITSVTRTSRNGEKTPPLGLINFLVIGGLYLANLLLVWLSNTRAISWTPLLVSPFILYLISLVLGFWGFRQQLKQTESGLSYRESGAFLYLGLALISTLTMAYAFATANDPLIEALEDTIIYTYLAVGAIFTGYVIINFQMLYRQALPVHRVLYKPTIFSLFQTRILAGIAIMALLSTQRFFPLNQAVAGYFNNLGDLHTATNEIRVAEQYYQLALQSEFQNHKSNYALASLALNQQDNALAAQYFKQALLKQPSPQAYAGLSLTFLQENLFFEAIKTLQQGIRTFPKSGELQNNLGFLYAKTSVADSAYYYFAASTGNTSQEVVPQTNLLAFWLRNPTLISLDSLAKTTDSRDYDSYQANRAALAVLRRATTVDTTQKAAAFRPDWLAEPDSGMVLSVGRFSNLYNYALLNRTADTTLLVQLQRLEQNPANQEFLDDLSFARAVANYYTGNQLTAFQLTNQLAQGNTQDGATFNSVTGLWMLEQGLYTKAAESFQLNSDTLSAYYRALAYTKAGDLISAQTSWEVAGQTDPNVKALADLLYTNKQPTNDLERAFLLLYNPPASFAQSQQLIVAIQDPNLRSVVAAQRSRQSLLANQLTDGETWFKQVAEYANLNLYAGSVITVAYMRLQNAKRQFDLTIEAAHQAVSPSFQAEKEFLIARAYEAKNQVAQARQQYTKALQQAPFNAEIVVAAARLEQKNKQTEKAYNLVVSALAQNEQNAELQKAYIDLCLDLGLFDYADTALNRLPSITTPTDYQAFLTHYQTRRTLIEKQRETFQ